MCCIVSICLKKCIFIVFSGIVCIEEKKEVKMTNVEISTKTVLKTRANFENFIGEYNPQIITSTIAGMPNANDRIVVKICDLTQNIDTLMDALTEEIIVNLEKPPIVAWMVTNEKEKIQNFVRILNQQSGTRGLKIFVFKASVNQDESDINIECILKPQYKENKYVRNDNTHAKIIQNEYWKKYLEITGRKISPGPRHYQRISVGKSGVEIMQTVNTAKNYVATEILIRENKDLYTRFLENKEKIEQEIGALDWRENEGKKSSRIRKTYNIDINNEETWEDAISIHDKMANEFKNTFSKYM